MLNIGAECWKLSRSPGHSTPPCFLSWWVYIFLEAECVCQDGGEGWKSGDGIVLASSYHELIAFGLPCKYSLPWENTNRILQDWTIPAPAVMLPTPRTPAKKPCALPFIFMKALCESINNFALDRCLLPLYLSLTSPLLSAAYPVPSWLTPSPPDVAIFHARSASGVKFIKKAWSSLAWKLLCRC